MDSLNVLENIEKISFLNDKKLFYIEDLFIKFLIKNGIDDVSISIYNQENIPENIYELKSNDSIVFSDESTILDDDGSEENINFCIISFNKKTVVFKSKKYSLSFFHEFKIFKKYYYIASIDQSLLHIPYTILFLELYYNIEQKKVIDVGSFLKKMKKNIHDFNGGWIEISALYCGTLIYYSSEVDILEKINQKNSIFFNRLKNIINENGEDFYFLLKIEEYVYNPTKECRDKNKKSENTNKKSDKILKIDKKENKKSIIREMLKDFFDVLFFWRK